jgi:alpha-1,3-mannosyltransferase
MKILHVSPSFHPCVGGIERYVEELCENLVKMGHTSDVVCLNTCVYSRGKLPEYQEYRGTKVFRIPYRAIGKSRDKRADKRGFYQISPKIFSFMGSYDIIHVHALGFLSDFTVFTKPLHRKPVIISPHGGFFHTKRLNLLKRLLFHSWIKLVLRGNETVVSSVNDYNLFSNISKCSMVSYSIHTEDFDMKRKEDGSILFIGRLSPNKRLDRVIGMLFFLKKKNPNIRLYIVGDGPTEELREIVKEKKLEKNVLFTGRISEKDKLRYLSRASMFVSASEYEAFGLSVVEAMAAGVPVIANNIHSFRNLIKNRENGFLVDFSKPKEVAGLINKLDKKKLTSISVSAKKSAKKYDWSETAKEIESLYKKHLKG